MNDQVVFFEKQDVEKNKVFAVLAGCIPVLFWLPLVAAKDSAFGKFYANNGLILLIIMVIGSVISWIPLVGLIGALLDILVLGFAIYDLVFSLRDEGRRLPLIGSIQLLN